MNHRLVVISIVLLTGFFLSPIATAAIFVSPAEIWVSMDDGFIDGNTSKIITVKNTYAYNVSVKAWMLHPDIVEWMRPNKTLIDNISWISLEPSRVIIPANGQAQFYIAIHIPNESKNQTYDQHWETRAALKIDAVSANHSTMVKEGYLVRVYVDTPKPPTEPSGTLFPIFYVTSIAAIAVVLLTIILYFYREKRRKNKNI